MSPKRKNFKKERTLCLHPLLFVQLPNYRNRYTVIVCGHVGWFLRLAAVIFANTLTVGSKHFMPASIVYMYLGTITAQHP